MRLRDLIRIASKAYYPREPDILIRARKGKDVGDTLAQFVVSELKETFDKSRPTPNQLIEATRSIERAMWQLNAVSRALSDAHRKEQLCHAKIHSHRAVRKSRRCKRITA